MAKTLQQMHDDVENPLSKQIFERIMAEPERAAFAMLSMASWLGSNLEWSMDDNFETTEGVVSVVSSITGVNAGDQSDEELAAWREVASQFGYNVPVDDDEDDDEDELGDEEEWDS